MSKLENLESISLWRTLVTPADVKLLSDLPKLERFYVNDQTSDSSSWVAAIQALPHLTGERHSHHYGTQDITQFPKGLTELEVLSANAHQLQYCGRFNRLRGVSLKYDVSDNDLKYLSGISSIEGIKIQSEKATASFAPFGTGFENLKSLAIWTPIMSRTGMEAISKLRNLHTLCFRTRANPDLSYLTQLPDLSELDLRSTPIDDESQTHLLKMKGLKKLDLRGTNLSLDAIERLENGLPHCEVTPSPALWRATLPKRLQNRRKKPQVKSCILGPGCD
ncbi:MAG: hypothetical protein K2X29_04045 [Candidatus Obscuribacterales bacterium]|nr:hypothetical protein [Candidatus Obscuribacterales bacterium]